MEKVIKPEMRRSGIEIIGVDTKWEVDCIAR